MYVMRYMRLSDIEPVLEIDRLSFPSPWSARSYTFEIVDNANAHMIALEKAPEAPSAPVSVLHPEVPDGSHTLIGYGGMWLIEGEAHISTIAVHPEFRGRGLGEVLLVGMLGRALDQNAEYGVLEVRVSNTPAINLYRKYGFEIVGRRRGYYRDNNEDAYMMHLAPLNAAYRSRFQEHLHRLRSRVAFLNLLNGTESLPTTSQEVSS